MSEDYIFIKVMKKEFNGQCHQLKIKPFDAICVTSAVCVPKLGFLASLVHNLGIMCSNSSKELGMM